MKDKFKNPGAEYRPIPFWSWNESLEPEILREQIRSMKKAGMGGYFMHARGGLTLDYLGEEWFECIQAGIEEGKACGLDAWVYDEEGWPSGFAGGKVPKLSEAFQAKFLKFAEYKTVEEAQLEGAFCIYVLHGDVSGQEAVSEVSKGNGSQKSPVRKVSLKQVKEGQVRLECGETLAVIRRIVQKTYIDVMNQEAVKAFLEVTHEEYYKRFGAEFGTGMKGFFTDEPRFTCNRFGDMPWSDGLVEEFERRYGYSLLENILCLWKPLQGYEKVRYHFWKMVNDLFVHNYMETLYRWCEEHNCMLTGHIMMEESIFGQMTGTGGVMPFYEYEHIPGIDWLRRRIESPVIARQVGSVACQLGRKKVLTESFALSGWNISLEELKWILEWQYVNGVNLLCQHLEAYSLKGSRKRDYPPSLFHQQSYFDRFSCFADYVGRLGAALSEGNQLADVLVLHPMRSGYVCYDGNRPQEIRRLDNCFREVSEYLSGAHVSYHYGDETIMSKYASVKGKELTVGEVSYRTVILPTMYSLDQTTLHLLNEFGRNGGSILSTGEFPHFTDGEAKLLEELRTYTVSMPYSEIRPYLLNKKLVTSSVAQDGKELSMIAQQVRRTSDGICLFLVNHSQEESVCAQVTLYDKCCEAELLCAEDGSVKPLSYQYDTDTHVELSFLPMQSYLILFKEAQGAGRTLPKALEQHVSLGQNWQIEEMGYNSLTLDICRYRVDDGELEGKLPVIHLMDLLLERRKDSKIELEYDFTVEMDLSRNQEFMLAMEDVQQYRIHVNGREVHVGEQAGKNWWKDRAFCTVDIKPYIRQGKNVLRLEGTFHQDPYVYEVLYGEGMYETEKNRLTYNMEMESVYLVGDFGVVSRSEYRPYQRQSMFTKGPFVIVDQPRSFSHPNFTTQGLLFFAGDVLVSQKTDIHPQADHRVILDYGKFHAPMADIFVNGELVKTACWAPYEADITSACREGENTIAIRFYASNRNLLGPHHHTKGESYGVGPLSFTGKWSWVERESEADGTDFEDRTQNFWTNEYAFVEFGPAER